MTSKFNQLSILFCGILLVLFSCKKEEIITNPLPGSPPMTGTNVLFSGTTVSTSIGGTVKDEFDMPVGGALVTIGTQTGYTNNDGIFYFSSVAVDAARAYVKIEKAGYFLGSRSFTPNANYTNYVRVKLLTKSLQGTVDNSAGGTVNISGGPVLTFEAGDVSLENGNAYNGVVSVHAAYLDPLANDLGEIMPGDFTAIDNSNAAVTLETFGMVVVELTGSGGEALNVASGQTVEITMPVAGAQLSSAPSTIPLWHFDEINGNWSEEGSATLQGSTYVGEVSHFSFWNCDIPASYIDFECRLVCYGTPVANTIVKLTMPSGASASGITDGNGEVNGAIPDNTDLLLEVIDECGATIHSQNVPASSSSIDLGDLFVCGSGNYVSISGTVEGCSGSLVTNGIVQIYVSPTIYSSVFTDQNGQFNTVVNTCSNTTVDVLAFDLDNALQSATMTIPVGSTINLGTITTCSQLDEFVNYTIDGTQYSIGDLGQNEVTSYTTVDSLAIQAYYAPNSLYLNAEYPVLGNNVCTLGGANGYSLDWPAPPMTMNITTLGIISGSYVEGTFSGTFNEAGGGPSHTISGNFRTKNY